MCQRRLPALTRLKQAVYAVASKPHSGVPLSHANLQAMPGAGAPPHLRVAIIESDRIDSPLAALLAGHDGVETINATTVADALGLVDSQGAEAMLLDPELPEGWPSTVAEQIVEGIADRMPVLIACRSAADAQVIGDRLGGHRVWVVQREQLTAESAIRFFIGAVARK